MTTSSTRSDYYEAMRAEGESFEAFVYGILYERYGWDIEPHVTFEQQRMGENKAGVEVKLDRNMHRTGNVYLELGETKYPGADYLPSGIRRRDNTWLYAIGNFDEVLVFGKTQLQTWVREKEWKRKQTGTSIGVLMPLPFARAHAELRLK